MANGVCRSVAYQGEPGAFSETAVKKMEPAADPVPCKTLPEVFARIETGQVDAGIVPVENSLAGSIGETYDLLLTHNLVVTGETVLPVDHCLMALPGTTLSQVKRVLSHPQALAQCNDYLRRLDVECVPHHDTAGAARFIKESGDPYAAAVASREAAEIHGLSVLAKEIQSNRENFTRFYRVERDPRPRGKRNRSVFVAGLPHHPGSLFMALSSFACRGINLTKIESRPVKRNPWEYVFFLEFEGHVDDWQIRPALDEVRSKTSMFRVLGSFALEE